MEMINWIVIGAGLFVPIAITVVVTLWLGRYLKARNSKYARFLGGKTRACLVGAASLALCAVISLAWAAAGERHDVRLTNVHGYTADPPASCEFTWPSSSAPHKQKSGCPSDVGHTFTESATAVRFPGTSIVVLENRGEARDPYSKNALTGAESLLILGVVGAAVNGARNKTAPSGASEPIAVAGALDPDVVAAPWPSEWNGSPDLSWHEIGQRSTAKPLTQRMWKHALEAARAGALSREGLPVGYPLPYTRIMVETPAAPGGCVCVLSTPAAAVFVTLDSTPELDGTATLDLNPYAATDLRLSIDDVDYNAEDAPQVLTTQGAEAVRAAASRIVDSAAGRG